MTALLNALGLASLLTALFALRYRYWRSPKVMIAYFSFFFCVEFIASHWFIPPGALGPEIGVICLTLAVVVWLTIYGLHWYEKKTGEDD